MHEDGGGRVERIDGMGWRGVRDRARDRVQYEEKHA